MRYILALLILLIPCAAQAEYRTWQETETVYIITDEGAPVPWFDKTTTHEYAKCDVCSSEDTEAVPYNVMKSEFHILDIVIRSINEKQYVLDGERCICSDCIKRAFYKLLGGEK